MIALDTDVLLIEIRYINDKKYNLNSAFLEQIENTKAIFTIYNFMELLGILSFNYSTNQLLDAFNNIPLSYNLEILWFDENKNETESNIINHCWNYIARKMSFNDALIIATLEKNNIETFISWNKKHFLNKSSNVEIFTPEEYLEK